MDLTTTPVLELRITYALKEEELVDRVADALREEFERLGIRETTTVSTGSEEEGGYTMTIFMPLPRGQEALEKMPELAELQSRLHILFLAVSRPKPNKTPCISIKETEMNAFGSFKKPRSEPRDRNGRPKKLTAQEVVDVLRKHERWYSLEQSHDGEQTRYLYRAVRTHETELKGRLGKYDIVSIDAFVQPFLVEFSYAHLYEDHDGIELILGCDWRSRGENVDAAGWYQTLHLVTVGALLRMKRDAETAAERTIA